LYAKLIVEVMAAQKNLSALAIEALCGSSGAAMPTAAPVEGAEAERAEAEEVGYNFAAIAAAMQPVKKDAPAAPHQRP